MLKISVIHREVPIYDFTDCSSSLNSEIYFVIPEVIPPVAKVNNIVEKLLSCPTRATPDGPIITDTIFTLTKPATILTNVEIEVNEKTLTISREAIFFINCIILLIIDITLYHFQLLIISITYWICSSVKVGLIGILNSVL